MRTNSKILSAIISVLLIFSLVAFFGACGGGGGDDDTNTTNDGDGNGGGGGDNGGDGEEANRAPVANAGPNQNVSTGSLVTLDGSMSSDANDDELTYVWSFTSMPIGSAAVLSDSAIVNPTFTPDIDGAYVVRLVVNDGIVNSTGDSVTITASTGNSPPVANAGPNQNVATGSLVTLDGSGSSDADGDALTYNWTITNSPGGSTASLSDPTIVNATFTADLDGLYEISLIVNDGAANSAADAVSITAVLPWSVSTIDNAGTAGGSVGANSSIAIDSGDKVHISYRDVSNDYLMYIANSSGAWIINTIDTALVMDETSLVVDSEDKVHIAYREASGGSGTATLKYVTNASDSWVIETVETGGADLGYCASIAIDSTGDVHIGYWDANSNDLKYATNASGSWIINTIDSAGNIGADCSLAIDSNDKIHISYADLSNYDLKYATNVSGSWITSTIDSAGQVGHYTSIALDSNDNVHISYCDHTNEYLKHATNSSGSWVLSIVDSGLGLWQFTDIALDSNNKAHIAYHHYSNDDLKYATNTSGSWVTSTIDSIGDVGGNPSIAIDSNDKAHISYQDYTNRNLKYAREN